jgi:hypothetical protein
MLRGTYGIYLFLLPPKPLLLHVSIALIAVSSPLGGFGNEIRGITLFLFVFIFIRRPLLRRHYSIVLICVFATCIGARVASLSNILLLQLLHGSSHWRNVKRDLIHLLEGWCQRGKENFVLVVLGIHLGSTFRGDTSFLIWFLEAMLRDLILIMANAVSFWFKELWIYIWS